MGVGGLASGDPFDLKSIQMALQAREKRRVQELLRGLVVGVRGERGEQARPLK